MTALFDRLEGHATQRSRGDVPHNAADAYLRSGWAAYFTGRAVGQRHLDMAVRIAHDTADHVLIAQCLAAHTHQALYYSPSIAVALSRQTARAADRAGLTRRDAASRRPPPRGRALCPARSHPHLWPYPQPRQPVQPRPALRNPH